MDSSNKRLAKNTIMLYTRMVVIMLVTLFTSRVILQNLGIEDYGIYSVVGGIIVMFGFISNSLSTSSQRFITYEIGKGDINDVARTFKTCLYLHILLAVIIAIIAEPVGIWFIENKLMIPQDRLFAAHWVYQFSIISMIVSFISTPYNALIIAHEKMNVFAVFSILDALLRLLVAYVIVIDGLYDRLFVYALLLLMSQIIIRFCYSIYCKRNFEECKIKTSLEKSIVKEIGVFASWSVFGNISYVVNTQGLNLLLGTFFLPSVNAARGIAVQVQSAVNSFVLGFQTAINPQITKSYAAEDLDNMVKLIYRSSRFSFYLLLIITMPILFETETILRIWLGTVPEYACVFVRLTLLMTWMTTICNPLVISVKATGNIKRFELTVETLMLATLPLSFILLKTGFPPQSVFWTALILESIATVVRSIITSRQIGFSAMDYANNVLVRIFIVATFDFSVTRLVSKFIYNSTTAPFIISIIAVLNTIIIVCLCGLTQDERVYVQQRINQLRNKSK